MIDFDKDVSAGIYVYAVEELGKPGVLKNEKWKIALQAGF